MSTPCNRAAARDTGHTLVELLLVLVLAAVLLVVAIPGYQQVQLKSRRKVAAGMLLALASRQEAFLRNYQRYAASMAELGFQDPLYIDSMASTATASRATYRLDLLQVEGRYTGVRAVAVNAQGADRSCRELVLGASGERLAVGSTGESNYACWQ